jgi:outer membrane protein OmpA-like peptidoglycan-associated protein
MESGIRSAIAALAMGVMAAGCASDLKYEKLPPDSNPSKEIDTLTLEMSQARKDQTDVYAPETFEKANEAYANAETAREKDRSNEDILDDVAKSRAYLQQAREHAQRAQGMLGEVYIARTRAVEAKAPEFADSKEQFAEADSRLHDFVRETERGETPDEADKTRVELMSAYQEAELHAMQQKNLGYARQQIEVARKEGAEEVAPKSLAAAEAKLSQGVATIKRDRTNMGAIMAMASEATQSADHLLAVTREAKGTKEKQPEDIAAARVSEREAMAGMQAQNKELQTTNEGLQTTQKELKSDLQRATRLTDTVRMIQAKFSSAEADVFEDGKQVHVRLKGLKFPSGSSTIQTSAYPLLSKVQNVLKDAEPDQIIIEGRTDSKGSQEKNIELSKKRAESVKQFLAANAAIEPEKVTTEGLGYQKPIAGNKTAEGRAANRGGDLLFTPVGVKAAQDAQAAGEQGKAPATQQPDSQKAGSTGESAPTGEPTPGHTDAVSLEAE